MDRGFSIQPDENIFEDHDISSEEPSQDYLSAQKDIEFFKHSRKFPPEINSIFEHLLRENGLTDAVPVSRDNIQMLPLLVNLLNLSAKEIDPYWYEHKPRMIMFMMGVYPSTFESNGVVYANTPFGQISSVGIYGAVIMIIHSFIDGFGIGVAFSISSAVGLSVALAVISHNISDGVNTTSTLLKNKVSDLNTKIILTTNVLAPLLGVISSFFFNLSSKFVLLYLAFFSGSILYLAISDILPHAHSDLKNKTPLLATLFGIVFIFVITLVVPHS
jgi:zinc transporter ZupT